MSMKIRLYLLLSIIFTYLFAASAFAEAAPTVSVGSAEAEVGSTVEIPVVLENNSGFSSIGIEIGYDENALRLTNVAENGTTGANFTKAQTLSVNPYNMSWDSATNSTFNGTLVTLTFELIANVNDTFMVSVDYYKGRNGTYVDGDNVNYDENFVPLGLTYENGYITVTGNDEPVEERPSVTAGSARGRKGNSVEIPIMLENNSGFASLGIEIGYDATALELVGISENVNTGATFTKAQELSANPYNMSWDSAYNTSFNGTLVTLEFEIITSNGGEYPITVDYYKGRNGTYIDGTNVNYDENFESIGLTYVNGSVTVVKTGSGGGSSSISTGGIAFKVTLDGDTSKGMVYAVMYDTEGVMRAVKAYPAADIVFAEFEKGVTGDYAKIMWWYEMKPVCESQLIPLK